MSEDRLSMASHRLVEICGTCTSDEHSKSLECQHGNSTGELRIEHLSSIRHDISPICFEKLGFRRNSDWKRMGLTGMCSWLIESQGKKSSTMKHTSCKRVFSWLFVSNSSVHQKHPWPKFEHNMPLFSNYLLFTQQPENTWEIVQAVVSSIVLAFRRLK